MNADSLMIIVKAGAAWIQASGLSWPAITAVSLVAIGAVAAAVRMFGVKKTVAAIRKICHFAKSKKVALIVRTVLTFIIKGRIR